MPIRVNPSGASLDNVLLAKIRAVELPTIGHFLEVGFADAGIGRVAGSGRLVGRAVTVRVVAPDSALVHRATELLEAGDVLVVDAGGDALHAPIGAVVATAVKARGAAGIVVDGPVTDLDALEGLGISIFARGTTALTTKLHALDAGGINVPVVVGRIAVLPGYVVVGDRDGLVIADPRDLAAVLSRARQSDEAEPEKLRRLEGGTGLTELSAAGQRLQPLLAESGERAD
jgi:regulator of RNase E activity RraA